MSKKSARKARHQNAATPNLGRGNPSSSSGRTGEQQFRNLPGEGLVHMVRTDAKWQKMSTSKGGTSQGDSKADIPISITTGATTSTGAGGGTTTDSHTGLLNLDADDHPQYVHISTNRAITAAHTFSGNTAFTGVPTFTNIDINGGVITGITDLAVADGGTGVGTSDSWLNSRITTSANGSLNYDATTAVAVNHDSLAGFVANEHIDHSGVSITAGTGLTGGGTIASSRTLNVVGGTSITANANDIQVTDDSITDTQLAYNTGQHLTTTSSPSFSNLTLGSYASSNFADGQIGSSEFVPGFTGRGWKISRSGNEYDAEFNNLTIRGTMSVYELLIQQIRATNGSIFVSSAAKVESWHSGNSQITFEDPSDNNLCPFADGDIIMMQRVKPGALVAGNATESGSGDIIKKMVFEVTAVSGRVVTVTAASGYTNSSNPSSGDEFVRIGNTGDTANRDGIIYLTADDSGAPFIDIKSSINSYNEWTGNAPDVRIGKLDGITDSDINGGSALSGFGMYSDSIYLKGEIVATSGSIANSVTIGGTAASTVKSGAASGASAQQNDSDKTDGTVGGWTIDGSAIFSGTKTTSGYTSNGHITFTSDGEIHTPTFYVESDGSSAFKGTLTIGSTNLTSSNTLNENTTAADVDLDNVANESPSTLKSTMSLNNVDNKSSSTLQTDILSAASASDVGLGNVDNTSDASVLGTAATAANEASKTDGYVGGLEISNTAILGVADGSARIVMTAAGDIVTDQWAIKRDGSASFANNSITFETNGDITSNDYLIERSRLFGAGQDSWNGSSYTDTWISSSTRSSAYGENTYAINVAPETSSEVSNGYGSRIMYRNGSYWIMVQDAYFKNFTVKGGTYLLTQGYRIFCSGTFTIENNAHIQNDGSSIGSVGTHNGAAGAPSGTLKGGASGHNSGAGGAGSGLGAGNGYHGGAGGGGGGMILISARNIVNNGLIRAKGGNGGIGEGPAG